MKYVAISPDFNPDREWRPVAAIVVDKAKRAYEFQALNEWVGEKVVPPEVYELPQEELERVLATTYEGYGYGAWTGRIASKIRRAINEGRYEQELV